MVHTTVAYCGILVFATAEMFLEMVELSKLYVGKRALGLPLDTCLVQLLLQECVLSLRTIRARPRSSSAPRTGLTGPRTICAPRGCIAALSVRLSLFPV
jgi:hypothetical protein